MDVAAADADVLVRVIEDAAERRQVDERAALGVGPAVAAADEITQPLGAIVMPCDSPLVARPVSTSPPETTRVPR